MPSRGLKISRFDQTGDESCCANIKREASNREGGSSGAIMRSVMSSALTLRCLHYGLRRDQGRIRNNVDFTRKPHSRTFDPMAQRHQNYSRTIRNTVHL